ncbi:MAG: HPr family phosphocarrier protein [Clostridia bacterium]
MIEVTMTLANKLGLHARPAAEIVKIASRFESKVQLCSSKKNVDAKSIIMMMTLGLRKGEQMTIKADGADEKDCIEALKTYVENKFYEE